MKTFTIDTHHVILYGLLFVVSVGALGAVHEWRLDLEKAKSQTAIDERAIADTKKQMEDSARQYQAQVELIQSLKVTPKTPAPVIITRLQGLEPAMNVLPDQLVAPKPDAPKVNLVLDPAQQVRLVNDLVDCKLCKTELAKTKDDLAKQKSITADREAEVASWKTVARGGALWTRVKRRAWHFLEDVVIIEAARAAAGHP